MSKSLPLILVSLFFLSNVASAMPSFVKKHFGEEGDIEYIVGIVEQFDVVDPYVYLQVKTAPDNELVWVATSKFAAKKGLKVRFRPGKLAKVFKSPKTGKVYSNLHMVNEIEVARSEKSDESCYLVQSFSEGDKVELSGLVTKVNKGILGKNWVHIQDAQNRCLSLDLTITTQDEPKVGDAIQATGTIHFDKNIGGAYHFPVLIEDASVVTQPRG